MRNKHKEPSKKDNFIIYLCYQKNNRKFAFNYDRSKRIKKVIWNIDCSQWY